MSILADIQTVVTPLDIPIEPMLADADEAAAAILSSAADAMFKSASRLFIVACKVSISEPKFSAAAVCSLYILIHSAIVC